MKMRRWHVGKPGSPIDGIDFAMGVILGIVLGPIISRVLGWALG